MGDFLYDESFWKWKSLQPGSYLHGWQLSDKAVAFQVDWINKGHPNISDKAVERFVQEAFEHGYDYVFEREYIGGRAGVYASYAPSPYEINHIYDNPISTQFGMASDYPFGTGFIFNIGDQNVSEEHPVVVGFVLKSAAFRLIKHSKRVKHHECPLKSKSVFVMLNGMFLDYDHDYCHDKEVVKRIVDTNRVPNAGDIFLGLQWPDLSHKITAEGEDLKFVDYGIGLETTTIVRRSYSYSDPDTKTQKIVLCANPKITVD